MSIEELLSQLQEYRNRRAPRDYRPDWLKDFLEQAAQLFEPLNHVGRVGYDCQCDERAWTVCLYLGTTEIVGGARDGQIDHVDFRIDLSRLAGLFETVTRLEWYSVACGRGESPQDRVRSLIAAHGLVAGGNPVRLELLAVPPDFVGPGLHCRPDGMIYETR